MKSALELAMEKANGMGDSSDSKPLTDAQREKIAELRKVAESKIAEAKIMMDSKKAKMGHHYPESGEDRDNFLREKAKIEENMESKIKRVREEG